MPKYKVNIVSFLDNGEPTPIYEQLVDNLDLQLVVHCINTPRDKAKPRAPRSDKGKRRTKVSA